MTTVTLGFTRAGTCLLQPRRSASQSALARVVAGASASPPTGTARASPAPPAANVGISTRLTHEQLRRNIVVRTHGSTDNTDRSDHRLAPRRLGRGWCGRADAEAWRHGAHPAAVRRRARVSQPRHQFMRREHPRLCALRRVRARSRSQLAAQARLARPFHDESTVHAHVPHSS